MQAPKESIPTVNRLVIAAIFFAALALAGLAIQAGLAVVLAQGVSSAVLDLMVRLVSYVLAALILIGCLLAIILGLLGLDQVSRSRGEQRGAALAWTTTVVSLLCTLLTLGLFLIPSGLVPGLPIAPPTLNIPDVGAASLPRPVTAGQRFSYSMYSIGAPSGPGWAYRDTGNGVTFQMTDQLDSQGTVYSQRSTTASARITSFDKSHNYTSDEFRQYACDLMKPPSDYTRYTQLELNCRPWPGPSFDCERLDALFEDHGTQDAPISPPLNVEAHEVACRHPDFYNAVVLLTYWQRARKGSLDADLALQADQFFRGIGMNYPLVTSMAPLTYESSSELHSAEPGENLALHKTVRVPRAQPGFPGSYAVNGTMSDWWGAGARPPQWIEIDLGANYPVAAVRLWPSQSPPGHTVHNLLVRGLATQNMFELIHTFDGDTSDNLPITYTLPDVLAGVRYVRIETTYSPSWVSWREIQVLAP